MRSLRAIEGCFQGAMPFYLATVGTDGTPSVSILSFAQLLDDRRVGLSYQFLRKTLRNLEETGVAQILMTDPATVAEYRLDVRFLQILRRGPVFDRMKAQLDGIASQTGMADVFRLAGVLECEVTSWEQVGGGAWEPPERADTTNERLEQLERVVASLDHATDLESLFDLTFEGLASHFGFHHGFLLMADRAGERLYTVASHGFEERRFGAEIAFGEGLYGACAAHRLASRHGSLLRHRLLSSAVARESDCEARMLSLPGLPDAESSLAVPLVHRDRCLGVLCVQERGAAAFAEADERALSLVARQLVAFMTRLAASPDAAVELPRRPAPSEAKAAARVKYYDSDGSVFVDDVYVIKGVAGRVLFRVLSTYLTEERVDFSNKEIRLATDLGMPAFKDNLETRLIALRRRLAERPLGFRIEKAGRGRFRLEVERALVLQQQP